MSNRGHNSKSPGRKAIEHGPRDKGATMADLGRALRNTIPGLTEEVLHDGENSGGRPQGEASEKEGTEQK